MRNKILLLGTMLSITIAYSQSGSIGIRTSSPSATVDIVSSGNSNLTKALEVNNSNANEMMTILDNGNIGINTAAPLQKLSIIDGINTNKYNGIVSILTNNSTSGIGIGWNGIQAIGSNTNNSLIINGKGVGSVILQDPAVSTGSVGIKTISPVSELNMINGHMVMAAAANPAAPLSNSWHDIAASTGITEAVLLRLVNTSTPAAGNTSLIGFNAYNGGGSAWGLGSRQISSAVSDSRFIVGFSSGGGYAEYLTIAPNNGTVNLAGNLIIGGSATKPGGGSWTATSDFRVKKDISPYTDGLKQLLEINPVVFRYNGKGDTKDDNKKYVGVIAQDIQKIAPYTVTETNIKIDDSGKGMLQLTDAAAFTYMTINAIKEQQAMITLQQKEIEELKQQVKKQATYLQK